VCGMREKFAGVVRKVNRVDDLRGILRLVRWSGREKDSVHRHRSLDIGAERRLLFRQRSQKRRETEYSIRAQRRRATFIGDDSGS
jgi:hypothetical protein